jgi:hypothetical protein
MSWNHHLSEETSKWTALLLAQWQFVCIMFGAMVQFIIERKKDQASH